MDKAAVHALIGEIDDRSRPAERRLELLAQLDRETSLESLKATGNIYFFGNDLVLPDYARAMSKLEQFYSANQSDRAVLFLLGVMYTYGIGCSQDSVKGIMFYHFAAERGSVPAMSAMGYAHRHGLGTDRSCARAKRYYYTAARKGRGEASV